MDPTLHDAALAKASDFTKALFEFLVQTVLRSMPSEASQLEPLRFLVM